MCLFPLKIIIFSVYFSLRQPRHGKYKFTSFRSESINYKQIKVQKKIYEQIQNLHGTQVIVIKYIVGTSRQHRDYTTIHYRFQHHYYGYFSRLKGVNQQIAMTRPSLFFHE